MQQRLLSSASRIAIAALLTITLVAPAGAQIPAQAQTPQGKKKILFDAIEEMLKDMPPARRAEVLKDLRAVGVGSWMKGTATAASDIDITFTHTDPRIERDFASALQNRINRIMGSSPDVHKINVTFWRDHRFADRFRGDAGQTFFYEYANETSRGRGCFLFNVAEEGSDIRLITDRVETAAFWDFPNRTVPKGMDGAARFLEDELIFLARDYGDDAVENAKQAAKYLSNYEDRLKGRLGQHFGDTSGLSALDDATKARMEALIEFKNSQAADAAGATRRLMERFGVASEDALRGELDDFYKAATGHLQRARGEVEALEVFARASRNTAAFNAKRALDFRSQLLSRLKDAVPLGALDLYFIYDAWHSQSPQKGLEALAETLLSYGSPMAAIVTAVTTIAKDLAGLAVEYAGNAFVFGPINDTVLKQTVFNEEAEGYIYGDAIRTEKYNEWPPDRGRLACWLPDGDAAERLVDDYLQWLSTHRWQTDWYARWGAGALSKSALLEQVSADLTESQQIRDRLQSTWQGLTMYGIFEPIDNPVSVTVNGSGPGGEPIVVPVPPGGNAEFRFDVRGIFTRGRKVFQVYDAASPDNNGGLYGRYFVKFCELGLEGSSQWLRSVVREGYRNSYTLQWDIGIDDTPGWQRTGSFPGQDEYLYSDPGAGRQQRLSQQNTGEASWQFGWKPEPGLAAGSKTATVTVTVIWNEWTGESSRQREVRFPFRLEARLLQPALKFVVVDAVDGRRIAGSTVVIRGTGMEVTDTQGVATFLSLDAGTLTATVTAEGYVTREGQFQFEPAPTTVEKRVLLQPLVVAAEPPPATRDDERLDRERAERERLDRERAEQQRLERERAETPSRPGQQPVADPGRCTAEIRQRGAELLALNAAQDPAPGGSVRFYAMREVQRCMDAEVACVQQVQARFFGCAPDADGRYTSCHTGITAGQFACANEEIRCTLSDYGCVREPEKRTPERRDPADGPTPERRQEVLGLLRASHQARCTSYIEKDIVSCRVVYTAGPAWEQQNGSWCVRFANELRPTNKDGVEWPASISGDASNAACMSEAAIVQEARAWGVLR